MIPDNGVASKESPERDKRVGIGDERLFGWESGGRRCDHHVVELDGVGDIGRIDAIRLEVGVVVVHLYGDKADHRVSVSVRHDKLRDGHTLAKLEAVDVLTRLAHKTGNHTTSHHRAR